jgi:hypothetical protein
MKKALLFCSLIICFMTMGMNSARIPHVKASDELTQLTENVMIVVNCTTGSVTTISTVTSSNASLVHFPSGVDLSDSSLIDVTTIATTFSTDHSFLAYLFNNTDATTPDPSQTGSQLQCLLLFRRASSGSQQVHPMVS